jgi:hypothetical protein
MSGAERNNTAAARLTSLNKVCRSTVLNANARYPSQPLAPQVPMPEPIALPTQPPCPPVLRSGHSCPDRVNDPCAYRAGQGKTLEDPTVPSASLALSHEICEHGVLRFVCERVVQTLDDRRELVVLPFWDLNTCENLPHLAAVVAVVE